MYTYTCMQRMHTVCVYVYIYVYIYIYIYIYIRRRHQVPSWTSGAEKVRVHSKYLFGLHFRTGLDLHLDLHLMLIPVQTEMSVFVCGCLTRNA